MVSLATHEWAPPVTHPSAAGPVAVLVHGVTGWWRTWWRVGPALAERGWHVLAVDLRGHGHSPRIDGTATVGDWAGDVIETIERRGFGRADALIAHSLGAAVAAELAHLRSDLVGRVVLEDPPSMNRAADVAWHTTLEREIRAAVAAPQSEVAREASEHPGWLPEDVRQNVEGRALSDREGILASFRQPTGARVLDLAPVLPVPALYLLAAEERSVFRGHARRRLVETLPATARLVVVDAAGHTIHRDRFDEYLAAVIAWIEPG